MKIRIVDTGEVGTVIGSEVDGQWFVELDDGTPRVIGTEKVQVMPPDWDLAP